MSGPIHSEGVVAVGFRLRQSRRNFSHRAKLTAMLALCCILAWSPDARANGQESKRQQKADQAHAAEIEAAQKAAESWLQVQDREDYEASWKAASNFFQQHVPMAAWRRRMNAVRKPMDPVLARTLNTAEYKTELPGLPRGIYVALVWETIFHDGHPSLESLVMVNEDGQWKMVGYAAQ